MDALSGLPIVHSAITEKHYRRIVMSLRNNLLQGCPHEIPYAEAHARILLRLVGRRMTYRSQQDSDSEYVPYLRRRDYVECLGKLLTDMAEGSVIMQRTGIEDEVYIIKNKELHTDHLCSLASRLRGAVLDASLRVNSFFLNLSTHSVPHILQPYLRHKFLERNPENSRQQRSLWKMNTFKRKHMAARHFLGLDEEIAWETRGIPTKDLPVMKTLTDLDALIFVIKDYTTVVIAVEEVRLFNAANYEAVRFRFPRKFYFSEDLEENMIRKQHSKRLKVIHAITAPAASGSSALSTVSFIPGVVDHIGSGMDVLRECWRTELSEFCATLHQNSSLRNLHIATKLSDGEGLNIDQLLNSSLVEISLPELREQGWRSLAVGLATNRTLQVLTLTWDAEEMEKFVQTRLSAECDSDVTWSMCNTTLETLVITFPPCFDLQFDSECVASMLQEVSCVSTFVVEYLPQEPARKLTQFANYLRQALMKSTNMKALHLHIRFHAKEIELILQPFANNSADHSPPVNTTLTGLVLVPDRWTKADLDAVGRMLRNNNSITHFGIRHLNPKKKRNLWKFLQRIGEPEIVEFIGRLCGNSNLQALSLRGWSVVDEKKVRAAVLGLLCTQKGLHIDLTGTGLASKNVLEPVIAQLQKNRVSEVCYGSTRSGSHHPSSPEPRESHLSDSEYDGILNGSISFTTTSSHAMGASRSRLYTPETVISEHNEDSNCCPVSTSTSLENNPDRPRLRRISPQPMFFSSFTYSQIVEATGNFQASLAEGGFGVVYEGELAKGTKIAVKDLKLSNMSVSYRQRIQWSFEAEMQTLWLIHHANLLRLLGYCTENGPHTLEYEFMANSSLYKWIFGDDPQRVLDWATRTRIAVGIARGLEYLNVGCNQAIVHLDVKPQNILLDANLNPKLADFGIAKLMDLEAMYGAMNLVVPQGTCISLDWLSECKITDLYSYGMTCCEISTGKLPFVGSVGVEGIGKATLCNRVFNFVSREGLIFPVYGVSKHNKHRRLRDNDKVNVDAKLKGKPAALKAMVQLSKDLNSPSFFQQHWTEVLGEMPESVFGFKLNVLHEFEPARKRIRTRNWSAEEIHTVLELTEESLRVDVGPDHVAWDYVSEKLWEKYGFDRDSNSCENLLGTLLQSYKATRDHESKVRASTEFDLECREIIERILAAKPFEEKTRSIQMDAELPFSGLPFCQFQSSESEMGHFDSDDCDEVLHDDLTDEEISTREYEGLSGDSSAMIESQAEVTVDSHVSPVTESCYESNSKYAGRKRSAATVMEDGLISRIAPFVNKQIEDALKPLISVLRSREEEKKKHREKLLAIEEQKLAFCKKMLLSHHVVSEFKMEETVHRTFPDQHTGNAGQQLCDSNQL